MNHKLCQRGDIPPAGSNGFAFVDNTGALRNYMVIEKGGTLHIYENSCPHIGVPLDFNPGKFLDLSGEMIICSTHGALFQIDDGHCVSGPCVGKNLVPVSFEIRGEDVLIQL